MEKLDDFILNFIGIGLPKCGTTWISEMLNLHPSIDFAKSKETFHFIRTNHLYREDIIGFRKVKTKTELRYNFDDDGRLKGEFSTMYIFDRQALLAIKEHNKDVKIIVCIRPPWEFLHSVYHFDKNSNFGHLLPSTFEEYFDNWNDKHSLVRKEWSFYASYLEDVFQIFNENQVFLIDMWSIKKNRKKLLNELYTFLEIDNQFVPLSIDDKVNATMKMRNQFIQKITYKTLEFLQKKGVDNTLHTLIHKRGWARTVLFKLLKTEHEKNKIPTHFLQVLKTEYKEEVDKIGRILKKYNKYKYTKLDEWK